jgi:catechol 2,3-dioxygenase-like lactoylglutathione lyase family enzyme
MARSIERTASIAAISPFFIVSDLTRSLDFYASLGFEPRFREPPEDSFFAIVGRGGAQIFVKQVGVEAQPNVGRHPWVRWDAFVYVEEPDALAEELSAADVRFQAPLGDTSDGLRGFEIRDPDGYVLFFGRPR